MFVKLTKRIVISLGVIFLSGISGIASAQSVATPFTSATRYDANRKIVGTIAPDPDGAGSAQTTHYAATRNTYDAAGRLARVEFGELASWQAESIAPINWSGFSIFRKIEVFYDAMDRKTREVTSSNDIIQAVAQYSYDALDRLECTAIRMNTATYASLPTSACVIGPEGAKGPDRITQNIYDFAGQLIQVRKAVGTASQQDYATYTYTPNGMQASVTDANGNRAAFGYDGFDRQIVWAFPNPAILNTASTTDFEQYGYDSNGNRVSLRKRDGRTITYIYDALNRMTAKVISGVCVSGYACTTPPASAVRNVYYSYDLRGLQTAARFDSAAGPDAVVNVYDGFGRLNSSTVSMSGVSRTVGRQYDSDSNLIRVIHPDGNYFTYDYDGLDRMSAIRENGGTQVGSYDYNPKGKIWHAARGAVLSTYAYDSVSRLESLADDLAGSAADVSSVFVYNPANQIVSFSRSNDAYTYSGYVPETKSYSVNGLNQYTAVSGSSLGYDSNGNLASNGATSFTYDVENRLVSATGSLTTSMVYDPLGRLYQTSGGAGARQFLYDGDERIAEYEGASGALLRRYVHGPGDDDPQLWYEGAGLTDRRSLQINHQGSIVSSADASGALLAIKAYDEYGVPSGGDVGAFQYTGQAWLPDLGMYYYKARIYSAKLGRFLQTDPIGYKDQINLYAYVGNDSINQRDPDGRQILQDRPDDPDWKRAYLQRLRDTMLDGANKAAQEGYSLIANLAMVPFMGPAEGVDAGALFAQATYREGFSAAGRAYFQRAVGVAVKTIDDLAKLIKNGDVPSSKVIVETITRDGQQYILNTRTAQALERAGVPRSKWSSVDLTGNANAEERLTGQLERNSYKPPEGCVKPVSTGGCK